MTQTIQVVSGPYKGHIGEVLEGPNAYHPDLHLIRLDAYPNAPITLDQTRFVEHTRAEVPGTPPLIVSTPVPHEDEDDEELPFTSKDDLEDEEGDENPIEDEDEDEPRARPTRRPSKAKKR